MSWRENQYEAKRVGAKCTIDNIRKESLDIKSRKSGKCVSILSRPTARHYCADFPDSNSRRDWGLNPNAARPTESGLEWDLNPGQMSRDSRSFFELALGTN